MNKSLKIGLGLVVAIYLMAMPFTRKIILVILPLGRGWDDFAFMILLVVGLLYWAGKGWVDWNKTKTFRKIDRHRNTRVKQVAWVALSIIASLFVPGYLYDLGNLLMYGKEFDPFPAFITTVVTLTAAIGGWNIISYFDRKESKK